ncbi:response regulator [Candidatus Bathyarchaeota archaeon]|nr:response regulator [Candidatus Bathyarchaeota archaeon]
MGIDESLKTVDRILIIDDDRNFTKLFSEILEGEGYETVIANNGAEALEILQDDFFAILIIDIRLPDIDGIELISKIDKTDPDMRKIILTGNPSLENVQNALKKGAHDYLVKPVKLEEIKETINTQLDKLDSELKDRYKSIA